ncbi:MAG: type II secretion system minor pseudopilin GspI [Gammaproteobacteria bacterium]|nr:type II secretion system minor pseudopilin GspI [Gammaproteobacteria bacterium]
MRPARGFTLIEILAAVAILAIAMAAILSGMARYADNAAHLRQKTVALWVAHNRLTEIELEPEWPKIGRSDGTVETAGAEWRWEAAVIETPDPEVRRVNIRVLAPDGKAEAAALSAFIASTGRQGE